MFLFDLPYSTLRCYNYWEIKSMRQRLDLDALLRKYETNYSPRAQPTSTALNSPRAPPKMRLKLKTEADQYENDLRYFNSTANRAQPQERRTVRDKVASVSFQMSKSECQALLLSLQEELAVQERTMSDFVDRCVDQMLEKFERDHEDLRRELYTMLDHSLEQSKRAVLDMVEGYRRQCPREYTAVGRHIASVNQEVVALLGGLGSSHFKRTIAEVVTKDFGELVKKVREEVMQANTTYRQGLASIELDRSKVARVQEALNHLYSWRREEGGGMKVSDDREEFLKSSRRSSKRKIFQNRGNNKMAMTEREGSELSAPKHMRRTFFNFDSNN